MEGLKTLLRLINHPLGRGRFSWPQNIDHPLFPTLRSGHRFIQRPFPKNKSKTITAEIEIADETADVGIELATTVV